MLRQKYRESFVARGQQVLESVFCESRCITCGRSIDPIRVDPVWCKKGENRPRKCWENVNTPLGESIVTWITWSINAQSRFYRAIELKHRCKYFLIEYPNCTKWFRRKILRAKMDFLEAESVKYFITLKRLKFLWFTHKSDWINRIKTQDGWQWREHV